MFHVDQFSIDRTPARMIMPVMNKVPRSEWPNRGAGPRNHRHDELTINHRMTQ